MNFATINYSQAFPASELDISLLGFLAGSDESKSVALAKNLKNNKTFAFKAGSEIKISGKKYTVLGVKKNLIALSRKGKNIALYKEGFPVQVGAVKPKSEAKKETGLLGSFKEEGFEREKNKILMNDSYRSKILTDLPKILMQASAEAVVNKNGEIIGFSIDQIDKDSIFVKSGLQNGDIITAINGEELDDVTRALKILRSLKKANKIDFTIKRFGQTIPISIDVQ